MVRLVFIIGILCAAFLLLIASQRAFPAPFVVADIPSAACNQCVWDGLGGPLVSDVVVDVVRGAPAFSNRICLRDVAAAVVGTNNVTIACRDSTSVWGDSTIVPFSFARPAPPVAPGNSRVTK